MQQAISSIPYQQLSLYQVYALCSSNFLFIMDSYVNWIRDSLQISSAGHDNFSLFSYFPQSIFSHWLSLSLSHSNQVMKKALIFSVEKLILTCHKKARRAFHRIPIYPWRGFDHEQTIMVGDEGPFSRPGTIHDGLLGFGCEKTFLQINCERNDEWLRYRGAGDEIGPHHWGCWASEPGIVSDMDRPLGIIQESLSHVW